MFERSLLATAAGPRFQPAKIRLATGAAAAHAGLLAAVLVAQVWRIDPVPPPPESQGFWTVILPDLGAPAPRRGNPTPPETRPTTPATPRRPAEPIQPTRIEELAPADSSAPADSAGTDSTLEVCDGCTPDGDPNGVPFGTGRGTGSGSGDGVAGDEVYVYVPGGAVEAPVILHRVQPAYPQAAITVRREGTAVVLATIDGTGQVVDARILVDPGFGLGASARDAVLQFRFRPATLNGRPVAVRYQLTVNFNLR